MKTEVRVGGGREGAVSQTDRKAEAGESSLLFSREKGDRLSLSFPVSYVMRADDWIGYVGNKAAPDP